MYDHATKSFWSTLKGEPVVGPLVDKGIKLNRSYVVTTNWADWKSQHPDTTVLSLDTGHFRNYDEGVAYQQYFATDKLMFKVPKIDTRLKNKDEVFALRSSDEQLAMSADFLKRNPVYQDTLGKLPLVVLTNKTGANRAYQTDGVKIVSWDGRNSATDETGAKWAVSENKLMLGDKSLLRMPAHRAFWFGWYSQFPETRLVK